MAKNPNTGKKLVAGLPALGTTKAIKGLAGTFDTNPLLANTADTWSALRAPPAVNPWDSFYKTMQGTIQTPAQIAATARQSALANEAATLAAQRAASNKLTGQYNQQADRAQGFALALAKLQQGQNDEAAGRYTQAANTLSGLGTGLTGAASEAYQGQVDQAKAAIARITGGLGEVSAPSAAGMANASNYAGVVAPSNTLVADAESAAQLAQNSAAAGQQNVNQIGVDYRAQATQEMAKAAEDARALIAQRPKSIQDLVQQLTTNRTANIQNLGNVLSQRTAFATAEQKRRDDLIQQQFTNQLGWSQYQTQRDYLADQTKQTAQTIETAKANITGFDKNGNPTFANASDKRNFITQMNTAATSRSETAGYFVDYNPKTNSFEARKDKKGNVVPVGGYILNPKDKTGQSVIPYSAPGKSGTGIGTGGHGVAAYGGLTPDQWETKITGADEKLADWTAVEEGDREWVDPVVDEDTGETLKAGFWSKPKPGAPAPKITYKQALQRIAGTGGTKQWKAQALAQVQSYYPEGYGWRPYETVASARTGIRGEAQTALDMKIPYKQALAIALRNAGALNIPVKVLKQEFADVYGIKPTTPKEPPTTLSNMPAWAVPPPGWSPGPNGGLP